MAAIVSVGIIFAIVLTISPAYSLTCTNQKFSQNRTFLNCSDLPVLSAYLHWTYNSSSSTLAVAFTAAPEAPEGWVAWAINPTAAVMAGAQSLVAYKQGGAVIVKPFVLNSYSSIVQSNLSYPLSDTGAEEANGTITLFATFQLPENITKFYHIWQVGSAVSSGFPRVHEFKKDNLNAKGTLEITAGGDQGGSAGAPGDAPSESPGSSPPGETPGSSTPGESPETSTPTGIAPSPEKAGDSGMRKGKMSYYLLMAIATFMIFYF